MRFPGLLAAAAAALCLTADPAPARAADDTAVTLALTTLVSTQTLFDHTQASEQGAGVTILFHRRAFTFGLNLDASGGSGQVDVYGGGLLGGEVPLFEHLRLGIFGEFGAHHLADPGTVVNFNGDTRHIDPATLPYGGGRVSLDLLLGGAVALDLGADAMARWDIGRTNTALRFGGGVPTAYRFGGSMVGAGAHLGIRF